MGLCRDIENPRIPARSTNGRRLWTCDAPSCDVRRVPWSREWQWYGSIKEWDNDPFSVFAICSDACRDEFDEAIQPKQIEPRDM